MNTIFLLAATVLFALYSIFMKYVPRDKLRFTLLITGIYAGIITLMYLVLFLLDDKTVSATTVLWSVLKGVLGIIVQMAYFVAMQKGPLSYTTFIFSASMIIPAFGSAIFWNEKITVAQWVAISLFLIAFYLISFPGADKSKKISKIWLPLCLTAFLLNGFSSIIVKAQQTALNGQQGNAMMVISNGVTFLAAIIVFVVWALIKKEKILPYDMRLNTKKASGVILGVAVCNGIANGFVTYLASRISGAWLFPCVLGGSMIMVTLFSVIVLKEKINKWGMFGLISGLAAMFVMNVI